MAAADVSDHLNLIFEDKFELAIACANYRKQIFSSLGGISSTRNSSMRSQA
jgi:hypothetical protein